MSVTKISLVQRLITNKGTKCNSLTQQLRSQMETCFFKSHCTKNKRPYKNPQIRLPHKTRSQLEERTRVQTSQIPGKKNLQTQVPLPYAFNIKNTTQLIYDLKDIPFDQNIRLASFDVSNMYTKIPTDEKLLC